MRAFLKAHKVNFTASDATTRMENTEIASRGSAVAVRVRCIRNAAAAALAPAQPAWP